MLKRLDPFLLLLLGAVGLAALVPARGVWADGFDAATKVAIALLFFLYGARLSTREAFEGLRHWRLHGTVVAATFVLFPLLGLALQLVPDAVLPHDLKLGVLFLACLPSTVQSSIAFTSIAKGNVPAAICAASLSNVLGVFLTPLLVGLLLSTRGGLSGSALLAVALQLLAPFLAGQLLRPWIGEWVARYARMLKVVDRGSILLVVYVAFAEGMVAGIWGRISLPGLGVLVLVDVALLAAVLAVTAWVPRLLGFSRSDRITILFCGSKKSLASGLPMAGVLFAGPAGPATALLVLPLMLFHQIQLLVCAWLAARFARAWETGAGAAGEEWAAARSS